MGFRSVCIESRCRCSYSGGYLVVTSGEETTKIHLSEIASLTFCTTKVYVSGYLMAELAKSKIPVVFSDEKCYPVSEALPLYGSHNCSGRISRQLSWTAPTKKRVWQKVVRDKILAQARNLTFFGHPLEAKVLSSYYTDVRSGDPTNREAAAAGVYFAALFGPGFSRDLDNDINAALNYGYSVVLSKISREIVSKGYLTQVGIQHRGELNPWNLSCDLMEPFRPFVDYVVLTSGASSFDTSLRRLLIDLVNRKLLFNGGGYKAASVMGSYVEDCLDALNRRIPVENIKMYEIAI